MTPDTIKSLVIWIPTGVFFITILISFLVGFLRGFRKSLILFIHAIVIYVTLAIIYTIIVNNPNTDKQTFNMINGILSATAKTSLQQITNTSASCASLKEVISEVIVNSVGKGEGVLLVLQDNGQYLAALVNMVYHLIFFSLFHILYYFLLLFMFIIYAIFYPERRYKNKKNKEYEELKRDKPYQKHPFLGSLVGSIRGLIISLLDLSVIGIVFFMVYGDGSTKATGYKFESEEVNTAYQTYDAMGEYGTYGIFKVLNLVKDGDNFPYYLYTANFIMSGNYTDESGKTTNVFLAKEFGAYTGFARKTMNLVLKYDDEKLISKYIKHMSNNESTSSELIDAFTIIMAKDGFQEEFDKIIDEFKAGPFVADMTLSFIASVVKYRDELGITDNIKDEQTIELLNVIFDGEDGLDVTCILTEEDTKLLLKSTIDILSKATATYEDDLSRYLAIAEASVPYITKLSILNDETRKAKLNPTLERLYNYLTSMNASTENTGLVNKLDIVEYSNSKYNSNLASEKIDWAAELKLLLDGSKSAISLFRTVYTPTKEIPDCIFDLFTSGDEEKTKLQNKYYDEMTNVLANSKLFGAAMSISFVRENVDLAVKKAFNSSSILLPKTINFANTYNNDGTIKEYGEFYYLFSAVKKFLNNGGKEIYETIKSFNNEEASPELFVNLLKKLDYKENEEDESVIDILVNSTTLQYLLSGILLHFDEIVSDISIIVPLSEKSVDVDGIEYINKTSIRQLFNNFSNVLDNIKYVKDTDTLYVNIKGIIEIKNTLLENNILHATMVNYLTKYLSELDVITIPDAYIAASSKENLLDFEKNIWNTNEEISGILDVFDDMFQISASDDFDLANALDNIATYALNLNKPSTIDVRRTKLSVAYDVDIIVATLSTQIDKYLTEEIVPLSIRDSRLVKDHNDILGDFYRESEVLAVLNSTNELLIASLDAISTEKIMDAVTSLNAKASTNPTKTKLDVLYSSAIIRHAITKPLDNVLNENLIAQTTRESSLIKATEAGVKYYKKNEIKYIIDFVNELEFTDIDSMTADSIKAKIFDLTNNATTLSGTKLDVLYKSTILTSVVSTQFDKVLLTDDPIVPAEIINSSLVKDNNGFNSYYKETEVASIINALKELGINNIDNIDIAVIKNEILNLNNQSITNSTEGVTKLNVIYSSNILSNAFTKPIDDALTSDLIPTEVRDSNNIKETVLENYKKYQENEIRLLIDSLVELGINDLDNINITVIKNEILNLNNQSTTNSTEGVTKLNVIYSSNILSNAFTKPVDDALTEDLIATDVRDSNNVKEEVFGNYKKYKENEIKRLIDSLVELNITNLDNINQEIIKDDFININKEATTNPNVSKLDVIYNSILFRNAITKPMDETLTQLVNSNVLNSDAVKEFENGLTVKYYKKSEIKAVIDSTLELGINDLSQTIEIAVVKQHILNLNESSITNNDVTKLDVIYSSVIIKYSISNELDKQFRSSTLNINEEVLSASMSNDNDGTIIPDNYYYIKAEVERIVSALDSDGLNLTDINTVKDINVDSIKSLNETIISGKNEGRTHLQVVYSSYIISDIISNKIDSALNDNSAIVNPDEAKEEFESLEIYHYKVNEVSELIKFLNNVSSTSSLNNIDFASITLTDDIKNNVLNSSVLYYTVSKNIINNDSLVTPKSLITEVDSNEKINDSTEMGNLLDVIITVTGGNVDSNAAPNLSNAFNNIELITASKIMRATISDMITTSSSSNLYVLVNDVEQEINNKDDSGILVFNALELDSIIKALKEMNLTDSYNLDLNVATFKAMDNDKQDLLLTSNTIRIIISDLLKASKESLSILPYDLPTHEEEVFDKLNYTNTSISSNMMHYTNTEIKDIVSSI